MAMLSGKFLCFSAFYKTKIMLDPPKKYVTPYGGRLEWELPGENKLVVHLKDKDKIRHKKRWSQVNYDPSKENLKNQNSHATMVKYKYRCRNTIIPVIYVYHKQLHLIKRF